VPQRVVILGAGFGGLNVARALEHYARPNEVTVTIVNRENYMLFTPMLPEVASGSVEARHIAPAVRAILPKAAFELGEITGVDLDARTVCVRKHRNEGTSTLQYDHLVVALGAETSTHAVPGAREHTFPITKLPEAVALRDVAITALENAATASSDEDRRALTTFVVIGGGFSGVEVAGEMLAFLRAAGRAFPRIEESDIRLVLVAGTDRLLKQLPQALGVRASKMLKDRGVEIVFSDEVAAIDAGGVSLKSGARFASRCVVWSAGVQPARLTAELGLATTEDHALKVEHDLSVSGMPIVWGLGDCAHVPRRDGGAYPQTAQHALHEAGALARNLLARVRGKATKPYVYRGRGMMASIGAREGLAEIGNRIALSGFPAWLLWRAYYLSQLPGYDRKTRVLVDWSLDLPLPKDIASVR
jgi:NADH dehydrogenase